MKIAIIGGAGKMGQWFCRHLVGEGKEVIVADKDENKLREAGRLFNIETTFNSVEAVKKADVIVISVPINIFEEVIKEISPFIGPEQAVLDITSIKAAPVAIMHDYIKTGLILGTHPLFGPGAAGLKGNNFVLTPTDEREKAFAVEVARYLQERGASVSFMGPEAHDKLMAVVQGFTHFVAIISADALSNLGNIEELKDVSSTTFRGFLSFVDSVVGQDPDLYAAIQMEHPEMPEIYRVLLESQQKWAGLVNKKDTRGFVEGMRLLKSYMENKNHLQSG